MPLSRAVKQNSLLLHVPVDDSWPVRLIFFKTTLPTKMLLNFNEKIKFVSNFEQFNLLKLCEVMFSFIEREKENIFRKLGMFSLNEVL